MAHPWPHLSDRGVRCPNRSVSKTPTNDNTSETVASVIITLPESSMCATTHLATALVVNCPRAAIAGEDRGRGDAEGGYGRCAPPR